MATPLQVFKNSLNEKMEKQNDIIGGTDWITNYKEFKKKMEYEIHIYNMFIYRSRVARRKATGRASAAKPPSAKEQEASIKEVFEDNKRLFELANEQGKEFGLPKKDYELTKEEEKVRVETKKILGKLKDGKIEPANIRVSCTCTRVPVIDGHTESVFVETEKEIDPKNAKKTYEQYNKEISVVGLPSAPKDYYIVHEDPTRPQPRIERQVGDGMTTTIGRLEKEELFDHGLKYMLFSHNKKMGSAKGAVLLAEMLYKKDKI